MINVNSNKGATIALQSLNKTSRELDAVQKRVSTGFRVVDARDDGAAFAVAQGLRADVKGNEAVNERLAFAKGLLSVTGAALKGISDSSAALRAVGVKLADDNLGTEEREAYTVEATGYYYDIDRFINQADFGGSNLIKYGTQDINVVSDSQGGTTTLKSFDVALAFYIFGNNSSNDPATIRSSLINPGGTLDAFDGVVNSAMASIGANSRSIENQDNFISTLSDTINDAIGSIVDADLAKDSAKLQALQIRQQLGSQSLSIANQRPSVLLSLFQ